MHSSPKHARIRRHAGFTLIELLTVIAIIGILAAIIIPTVGKVRQTAKKAQCVSRLRQWGSAANLAASEYKSHVPLFFNQDSFNYGNYFTGKNMIVDADTGSQSTRTVVDAMSICPTGINGGNSLNSVKHYAFVIPVGATRSAGTVFGTTATVDYYRMGEASAPSKLMLMVEVSNLRTLRASDGINTVITADNSIRKMQTSNAFIRHGGTAFALFLDGHVSGLSLTDTDYAQSKDTLDQYFTLK